jgi:hypothetical protein
MVSASRLLLLVNCCVLAPLEGFVRFVHCQRSRTSNSACNRVEVYNNRPMDHFLVSPRPKTPLQKCLYAFQVLYYRKEDI